MAIPIYLPPSMYAAAKRLGYDLSGYAAQPMVVTRPVSTSQPAGRAALDAGRETQREGKS